MEISAEVSEVVRRPSRLRALAELEANAESSAAALDRIARTACRVLDVPVVLVNLVGADRQRFVACGGPEPWASMREMPITAGFCPFALGSDVAYSFSDAHADPALASNPAVEQLGVVAYAGVPLRTAGGEPVGTLCALDYEPRTWSEDDLALLTDLAAGVIAELQLLAAARLLARDQARLHALTELSFALVPAESPGEVTETIMSAVDRFHPNAVWLLMLDESEQTLRTAAATGSAARPADVPLTAPVAPAEAVRTGEPGFYTTRAEVRSGFPDDAVPDAGAAAVLPLTAADHHIGALAMSFADERPFSADDRAYLAAIGGVSGLALARGRDEPRHSR
jgi:GAF domain-containing protein